MSAAAVIMSSREFGRIVRGERRGREVVREPSQWGKFGRKMPEEEDRRKGTEPEGLPM